MKRLGPLARTHGLDVLVVLAAVGAALEAATRDSAREADTSAALAAAFCALLVLPLLARRRLPFAAPAALWVLAVTFSFADGIVITKVTGVYVAGLAAAFLLGNLRDRTQAQTGLALVIGAAAILVVNKPDHEPGELAFVPALFGIAWLVGYAYGRRGAEAEAAEERATQAEREREAAARLAVAEERTRIARELHDIVAHSMSVMVLQVGAVRRRLPAERADDSEALAAVEGTGRTALAEMRRLLGAMRADGEAADLAPQPGLERLDALLGEVRGAGLPVELNVEGEAFPLPAAVDLSAYRIVQEGLTNALKHARARSAEVLIGYGADELRIEVRNDGGGHNGDAPALGGSGNGLIGIRERVKIYGGEMSAQGSPDGGFVLSTRLPLGGYRG